MIRGFSRFESLEASLVLGKFGVHRLSANGSGALGCRLQERMPSVGAFLWQYPFGAV